MNYRWRYLDAGGHDIPGPLETFADQVCAEEWLSQTWSELLDTGISQVTLLSDEAKVYGPMNLLPD